LAAARAHAARILTFGETAACHHRVTDIRISDATTVVQGRAWRQPILYKVAAPGRHFAVNAMGVLAVVQALRLDIGLAIADLATWAPPAGRGTRERIQIDPLHEEQAFHLIDDAFNANPSSMVAALEVLAAARPVDGAGRVARGRRIAVLGDMLELGVQEQTLHRGLADLPDLQWIETVHCVGPRMRALWEALPRTKRGDWTEAAPEMAARASRLADAGDVVLVKGSKGSKVSLVVDALRKLGHPAPQAE
jgi:UDP-N-acetylmuramoyl-tripeptide--D-alanyl-D-alanine ligase